MPETRNFTFTANRTFVLKWNIKPFSMFSTNNNNSLRSSVAVVPFLDNSEWYLKVSASTIPSTFISCYLCRTSSGPESIEVFYDLSIKYFSKSKNVRFKCLEKFSRNSSLEHFFMWRNRFMHAIKNFDMSKDTLEIECCLGNPVPASPYLVGVSITSKIPIETSKFFSEIKNFSHISSGEEEGLVNFSSASRECSKLKCTVTRENGNQALKVNIWPQSANSRILRVKCKVELVDIFGKRHFLCDEWQTLDGRDDIISFDLYGLSGEKLNENKDLYVPDNKLLLYWELVVSESLHNDPVHQHYETNKEISYDTPEGYRYIDVPLVPEFKWSTYLEQQYYKHRYLYQLLAILVLFLSIMVTYHTFLTIFCDYCTPKCN